MRIVNLKYNPDTDTDQAADGVPPDCIPVFLNDSYTY